LGVACISTRAQVWCTDLAVATLVFAMMMISFFRVSTNLQSGSQAINAVGRDAWLISTQLLSSGQPENWDETNVIRPGFADNNIINQSLIARLANISYEDTRHLLGVDSNFLVFFLNRSGDAVPFAGLCSYGLDQRNSSNATVCAVDMNFTESYHVAKSERVVFMNADFARMCVYTWRNR